MSHDDHLDLASCSTTRTSAGRSGSPRRRVAVLASVVVPVAALTLAGCGGVATQGGGGAAAGGGSTGASTSCPDPIKIGAPLPLSGALADFGKNSLNGMQLAAEEINAAGGIKALGGKKLDIQSGDTSSGDTAQGSSATTKLIQDGSVSLVGAWLSTMTTGVSTVAEQSRVPILTQSWADALSTRGYQYYFQPPPKSSVIGDSATTYMIEAAKAAGVSFTNVAGVGPNDVANTTQIKAALAGFQKAGVQAGEPTFFQAGITDPTPIVSRLASSNADLILMSGPPSDVALIVKALRGKGINTPIMGFGGAFVVPSFGKVMGDSVNGLLAVGAWNWDLPLDGVKQAADTYQKEHGEFMPMEAGESWNDVYLLASAMEQSKACDPQTIATTLRGLKASSGAASAMPGGEVSFSKDGTNPNAAPILTQWQGGKTVTVWPKKYATAELKLK